MSYTYDYMYEKLVKSNECCIRFTKVDGTERLMRATLNEKYLPAESKYDEMESTDSVKFNKSLLTVWDLDKQDWRRFIVDKVKEFTDLY